MTLPLSRLERDLAAQVRGQDPWSALELLTPFSDLGYLSADDCEAWYRIVVQTGRNAPGVLTSAVHGLLHRAAKPSANLAALRRETLDAFLKGELGTGQPAATAALLVLDLINWERH